MARLTTGQLVDIAEPSGRTVPCSVIAAAGRWVLLSHESDPLPDWIDGDIFLVYFEGNVHLTRMRGDVERGSRPGELRFEAAMEDIEPRSAPRVSPRASVAIVTSKDMIEGELLDISGSGIRVREHPGLEPGVTARMMLQLPDGPFLDVDVEFTMHRPVGVFARFVEFRDGSAQEVATWCVDHLRSKVSPPAPETV